jgi:hypothetical protein
MGRKKHSQVIVADAKELDGLAMLPGKIEPLKMAWDTCAAASEKLADMLNRLEGEGCQIIQILPASSDHHITVVYRKPA